MKRTTRQIAALAGILLAIYIVCRLAMGGTTTVCFSISQEDDAREARVIVETPDIVECGAPELSGNFVRVPVRPLKRGATGILLQDAEGGFLSLEVVRVGWLGTVYSESTGGFTGDALALAEVTAFCLLVAAIMFRSFRQARGPAFYAYGTIYAAGFSLFALFTGLMMLRVTLCHVLDPEEYIMLSAYGAMAGASFRFIMATAPLMLAFAAAMAVSNIALLRHERFRPQNVLGIGVAAAMMAGEAAAWWLYTRDFSGSLWQYRLWNMLNNVCATVYAYFECMLAGAVICGVKAARHVPAPDVDYLVILGCRFRRDGTLPPLLRGRVDRALEFWRAQKAATGREALLVPSGGQGPDETMPEAEAMRRYLRSQGIPEAMIRVEDRSRNTYQNMEFSRALIEGERPGARVAYVTTNYHVFRSGVWARLAGLRAEGVGSRTKWWFWPNAFMRECAGLLKNRLPQELLLLLAMLAVFGALSMTVG